MSLFKKFFGGGSSNGSYKNPKNLTEEVLQGTIDRAGFEISFDLKVDKSGDTDLFKIDFFGEEENLFTEKDGALLDAFQLFLKRAIQHYFPEDYVNLALDCNGFREKANQGLVDLAEKLKKKALEQGKSVYVRALPPKDRKVVHQFLANDERVKSRSVGDGLYKKIKIYPTKNNNENHQRPN